MDQRIEDATLSLLVYRLLFRYGRLNPPTAMIISQHFLQQMVLSAANGASRWDISEIRNQKNLLLTPLRPLSSIFFTGGSRLSGENFHSPRF